MTDKDREAFDAAWTDALTHDEGWSCAAYRIWQAALAESAKGLAEKDGAWVCAGHGANFTQDCDECWWVKRCNEKDAEIERIAGAIHWPECWDTAAYPTLLSALQEIGCNPEHCTKLATTKKEG